VTFRVRVSATARRDLETRLPHAVAAAALEFIHGPLAENPHRVGKPLKRDLEGLRAARRGQYRVVYKVQEDVVSVVRVRHRSDVYY
jgi:mRNA-degrading endonuclease RelE of RelBE toxin-antitoxin system